MSRPDRSGLTASLLDGTKTLGLVLSDVQAGKLIDYVELLLKWNSAYNLTAIRDPGQMLTHHLLDSLAVVSAFDGTKRVLDVGAGAGLPGIVLAIWAQEAQTQMHISMVDTVHKKTAFLTQVKAQLGLDNVAVHTGRVEKLPAEKPFDVITSRAFASLADFVTWSGHLLVEDGRFLAMKGVLPEEEMVALPPEWKATGIRHIDVPGLDAERHLITIERNRT